MLRLDFYHVFVVVDTTIVDRWNVDLAAWNHSFGSISQRDSNGYIVYAHCTSRRHIHIYAHVHAHAPKSKYVRVYTLARSRHRLKIDRQENVRARVTLTTGKSFELNHLRLNWASSCQPFDTIYVYVCLCIQFMKLLDGFLSVYKYIYECKIKHTHTHKHVDYYSSFDWN